MAPRPPWYCDNGLETRARTRAMESKSKSKSKTDNDNGQPDLPLSTPLAPSSPPPASPPPVLTSAARHRHRSAAPRRRRHSFFPLRTPRYPFFLLLLLLSFFLDLVLAIPRYPLPPLFPVSPPPTPPPLTPTVAHALRPRATSPSDAAATGARASSGSPIVSSTASPASLSSNATVNGNATVTTVTVTVSDMGTDRYGYGPLPTSYTVEQGQPQPTSKTSHTDPLLAYMPDFVFSVPSQSIVSGIDIALVIVLVLHLIFTFRYHYPLSKLNYILQLSSTLFLLLNLCAEMHVVLAWLQAKAHERPYMFPYIAVEMPPNDDDDDSSWTDAETGLWLMMKSVVTAMCHCTLIQFLTLLFPSRLEAKLICWLLVPLALASSGMEFMDLAVEAERQDLGDAVRSICNSTLALLYSLALVIWGVLVNRRRAWRTDGGTAAFGGGAMGLATLNCAIYFAQIKYDRLWWLPGLGWTLTLWQSWLGFWWWVGAGMGIGEVEDMVEREEKERRKKERKRLKEEKEERTRRKKLATLGGEEEGEDDHHHQGHLDIGSRLERWRTHIALGTGSRTATIASTLSGGDGNGNVLSRRRWTAAAGARADGPSSSSWLELQPMRSRASSREAVDGDSPDAALDAGLRRVVVNGHGNGNVDARAESRVGTGTSSSSTHSSRSPSTLHPLLRPVAGAWRALMSTSSLSFVHSHLRRLRLAHDAAAKKRASEQIGLREQVLGGGRGGGWGGPGLSNMVYAEGSLSPRGWRATAAGADEEGSHQCSCGRRPSASTSGGGGGSGGGARRRRRRRRRREEEGSERLEEERSDDEEEEDDDDDDDSGGWEDESEEEDGAGRRSTDDESATSSSSAAATDNQRGGRVGRRRADSSERRRRRPPRSRPPSSPAHSRGRPARHHRTSAAAQVAPQTARRTRATELTSPPIPNSASPPYTRSAASPFVSLSPRSPSRSSGSSFDYLPLATPAGSPPPQTGSRPSLAGDLARAPSYDHPPSASDLPLLDGSYAFVNATNGADAHHLDARPRTHSTDARPRTLSTDARPRTLSTLSSPIRPGRARRPAEPGSYEAADEAVSEARAQARERERRRRGGMVHHHHSPPTDDASSATAVVDRARALDGLGPFSDPRAASRERLPGHGSSACGRDASGMSPPSPPPPPPPPLPGGSGTGEEGDGSPQEQRGDPSSVVVGGGDSWYWRGGLQRFRLRDRTQY